MSHLKCIRKKHAVRSDLDLDSHSFSITLAVHCVFAENCHGVIFESEKLQEGLGIDRRTGIFFKGYNIVHGSERANENI